MHKNNIYHFGLPFFDTVFNDFNFSINPPTEKILFKKTIGGICNTIKLANNLNINTNLIISKKKILILGGKFKKQLKNSKFVVTNTLVLLFGNQTNLFLDHLNFINSNYYNFRNLNELIKFLNLILKFDKYNYILFSPGGESFDSYQNYLDRGKHFNQLIKGKLS